MREFQDIEKLSIIGFGDVFDVGKDVDDIIGDFEIVISAVIPSSFVFLR